MSDVVDFSKAEGFNESFLDHKHVKKITEEFVKLGFEVDGKPMFERNGWTVDEDNVLLKLKGSSSTNLSISLGAGSIIHIHLEDRPSSDPSKILSGGSVRAQAYVVGYKLKDMGDGVDEYFVSSEERRERLVSPFGLEIVTTEEFVRSFLGEFIEKLHKHSETLQQAMLTIVQDISSLKNTTNLLSRAAGDI